MTQEWAAIEAELNKPLHKSHVKARSQSGRTLSYIEGWHAIAEANRIFGFDAWTRETIETKCVAEHKRKIGREPNQRDGWGVSYTAKVRVVVGGVVREGIGAGHGIDVDLGLAHESAIKEAETDAMKRALMTFGNPFGLALYDKTQANVSDEKSEPKSPGLSATVHEEYDDSIVTPFDDLEFSGTPKEGRQAWPVLVAAMRAQRTVEDLETWSHEPTNREAITTSLPPTAKQPWRNEYWDRFQALRAA